MGLSASGSMGLWSGRPVGLWVCGPVVCGSAGQKVTRMLYNDNEYLMHLAALPG